MAGFNPRSLLLALPNEVRILFVFNRNSVTGPLRESILAKIAPPIHCGHPSNRQGSREFRFDLQRGQRQSP